MDAYGGGGGEAGAKDVYGQEEDGLMLLEAIDDWLTDATAEGAGAHHRARSLVQLMRPWARRLIPAAYCGCTDLAALTHLSDDHGYNSIFSVGCVDEEPEVRLTLPGSSADRRLSCELAVKVFVCSPAAGATAAGGCRPHCSPSLRRRPVRRWELGQRAFGRV